MTVRRAHVYTYGLDGIQSGVLGEFLDIWVEERLGEAEELHFITPGDHPHNDLIVEDQPLRYGSTWYYVDTVETERVGSKITLHVKAFAKWYRLANTAIVGTIGLSDRTAVEGAAAILFSGDGEALNWSLSYDGLIPLTTYSREFTDQSVLVSLRQWAALTSTYLRFDTENNVVYLAATSGEERGIGFRYGRNVSSVKRICKPPSVTRLYAAGAGGLDLTGILGVNYVERYSWYTGLGISLADARTRFTKSRIYNDPSITDEDTLYAAAKATIAPLAQGVLGYQLSVADLSEFLGVTERFNVGDYVRVADGPLDVDVRTTITRRTTYPLAPSRNKVELSYLQPTGLSVPSGASAAGGAKQWLLFGKNNAGTYQLRNDVTATINRIGLRFRDGGEAMFHHQLRFTGVGAGSLSVSALDADSGVLLCQPHSITYTDGQVINQVLLSAWLQELSGDKDYRIRIKTTASGGAGSAKGVNVAVDDSKFHILTYAAVRQTITWPNSQLFSYTGAVQNFVVPDGISEVRITAKGGQGGESGGRGGAVTAVFPVLAGSTLDVYVGGAGGSGIPGPGWPNGGTGNTTGGSSHSGGGGGSSDVRASAAAFAAAMIVAAGGGGLGEPSASNPSTGGGSGGFYNGANGTGQGGTVTPGGATQTAGGTGTGGADGAFNQGGNGAGSGNPFDYAGGGGGGGWYGGEGGPAGGGGNGQAGGGGGSGWVDATGNDFEANDASNTGNGTVLFEWGIPIES